jgi:uncharacterized surface protein with fasciclin (FAS1) repeats
VKKLIYALAASLILPLFASLPASAAQLQVVKLNGSDGKDIVEIASGSKDHTTLVKAVVAAGLVETLTGPGPYTIFAPTNEAFAALPKGTVETLLKPENKEKLKSILEHHAAAPAYSPSILRTLNEVDMVDGPKLKVKVEGDKIFVNGVEIKAALAAKNGIVYVIGSILPDKAPEKK